MIFILVENLEIIFLKVDLITKCIHVCVFVDFESKGDRVRFESQLDESLNRKVGQICGKYDAERGRYPVKFEHDKDTVRYVLPKFLFLVESKEKTENMDVDVQDSSPK